MAGSVSEVEQLAFALFLFVPFHNTAFVGDALRDDLGEPSLFRTIQQQLIKRSAVQDPGFDGFRTAIREDSRF